MTGMILCASGEIHAQNYDMFKTIEEKEVDGELTGKYLLHQSLDCTLVKGDVSTLTSQARNIHTLKAKKVVLDKDGPTITGADKEPLPSGSGRVVVNGLPRPS